MDLPEQYIEMCRKAKEIQQKEYLSLGDFVYWENFGNTEVVRHRYALEKDYLKSTTTIWLPRQDQLQEMLESLWRKPSIHLGSISHDTIAGNKTFSVISWLGRNIRDHCLAYEVKNYSLEMIMLTMYMCEKFNKLWDGSDWIVQPEDKN